MKYKQFFLIIFTLLLLLPQDSSALHLAYPARLK